MVQILYECKDYIVIVKPVGMDSEHDIPAAIGSDVYPIHRLDKNVGGVMVFARNKQAAASLSKTVQEGSMIKEYVALIHGTPPESGDWTDLLWKDIAKNKVFVVKRERKGVKKARLEFQRITSGETSLVHIRLHTGRSHQIRVQFSSRGFPLVGDHKYGSKDESTAPMLFSRRITFPWKNTTQVYEYLPDWKEITNNCQ